MNKLQLLEYLKEKGFSKEIINAFKEIKREDFVSSEFLAQAYENIALPIRKTLETTISQPYTIAEMLSLLSLEKGNKVLEIGSGSGYVLALINKITKAETYGIEIIKELVEKSTKTLKSYNKIRVFNKNGVQGLEEFALFDRIIISAAIDKIPQPLVNQLKENGVLVAPVKSNVNENSQTLVKYKKVKGKLIIEQQLPGFVFVPFIE